ncbi:hypothetical protein ETAA8_33390 [Anatilimnocola aggregata]|uniref:Carboxypeptidase regulatory-like domain-containing protein n=1 Tax=Anatilimnocola aggregata TaxID=2528021 RepID=A0A517YDG9_9BACT|nr:hypothetical protein [Anatilimnocola aggregata]QDU28239.1 hypothetical protein ETAA8_33390 [Anatilimnocola aggregata]
MSCFVFRSQQLGCLLAILFLAGCGDTGPKTYKIPGKLVYEDGTPVPAASVVFQTTLDGQVIPARGVSTPEGQFELTTFNDGDGVVAGEHDVAISPVPAPEGAKPVQPPVPSKYGDFANSGLRTSVTPETKEIVITIDRLGK